jgi:hypothetical protein
MGQLLTLQLGALGAVRVSAFDVGGLAAGVADPAPVDARHTGQATDGPTADDDRRCRIAPGCRHAARPISTCYDEASIENLHCLSSMH